MPNTNLSNRWKLPKHLTPYVFAFYMAAIMAFLMCAVIVASRGGIDQHFLSSVWQAYLLAMPVAFVCVILVRPLVMRLVGATVRA